MSGKASRNKGANYERRVANYLTDNNIAARRRVDQYAQGGDDLVLDLNWLSVECKDVAATSVGAWVDQAIASAGQRIPVVIHHRRGNGDVAKDFATIPVSALVQLIHIIETKAA